MPTAPACLRLWIALLIWTALPIWIALLSAPLVAADSQQNPKGAPVQQPTQFRIQGEHFVLDGKEFRIKAISLEPFMPGEAPGTHDPKKLDYSYALAEIKALNANTVYLLTGNPRNIQPAFFQRAKAEGLHVILGLWFSGEANDYRGHTGDFQDPEFKDHVKTLIRDLTDRIHNLDGVDYSPQILFVTLGNEFLEGTVRSTDARHKKITSYKGAYASVSEAGATECFLAEMMDYFKSYEAERYGQVHYVSHHTWPVISPKITRNRFLDVISYNLYSYWPDWIKLHKPGSPAGTPYQGALEEIAAQYPEKPFVVSEFGISVAPKNVTVGTDEPGQASEIEARWKDIITSTRFIAGATVHQLFDQWCKDDGVGLAPERDPFEHDPTDREEWFGVIDISGTADEPKFRRRPAFAKLSELWKN